MNLWSPDISVMCLLLWTLNLFVLSQTLSLNVKLKYLTRQAGHHALGFPFFLFHISWDTDLSLSFYSIFAGPNAHSYAYPENSYQGISQVHLVFFNENTLNTFYTTFPEILLIAQTN